jgi:uncharacterized MAPEG superfamily protein
MSHDLQMLVWSAVLAIVQMLIAAVAANRQLGTPILVGNRESVPALTGWAGRAQRAHLNMLESLAIFAIFVIVAQLTGRANASTAIGATLFFWARLIYAVVYVAGIPWLRTLIWAVSFAGIILVARPLL